MTATEFIEKNEIELGREFPDLVIRLFPDPDDDSTFFAYMFCVPDGTEREVKGRARDCIRRHLTDNNEWSVIPSVKSLSVTKEHYPQYLKTAPMESVIPNAVILPLMSDISAEHLSKPYSREVYTENDYIDAPLDVIQLPRSLHENRFKLAA